jgi:protein TonB
LTKRDLVRVMRDCEAALSGTGVRKFLRAIYTLSGAALALSVASACIDKKDAKKMIEALQNGVSPDSLPVMRNVELPFKYPAQLYAQKIQGNVTLRIHIDTTGEVRPESTTVLESSGYPALDSAAVNGSRALHFRPAFAKGAPLEISVLFPVYFRHPEAAPLPGDTVLKQKN